MPQDGYRYEYKDKTGVVFAGKDKDVDFVREKLVQAAIKKWGECDEEDLSVEKAEVEGVPEDIET